jgi:hypothetical protein
MRPLRLFMSAEKLRTIRIVLLKSTHWPFVALILAWEKGRQQWLLRAKHRGNRLPFKTAKLSLAGAGLTRRPPLGRIPDHPTDVAQSGRPSLVTFAPSERSSIKMPAGQDVLASHAYESLETALRELQERLDLLSSLLQKQGLNSVTVD